MIFEYLEKQNININKDIRDKLNVYCGYLLEENSKYNLTAITDVQQIWIKHFADSILGSVAISPNSTVCDIGCGAGFPSIPLKLARNDLDITLVDSLGKRVDFCRTLCSKLNVEARFFHERAEDFAKTHAEEFDAATARAVAPLNILLEYTAQVVKIGGEVVAYKTDLSEVDKALNACKMLGLTFENHFDFVLPDGSKRSILVFRKISHTPKQFPRGQNKARKSPLV